MAKKILLVPDYAHIAKVVDQDLRSEQYVDGIATDVLDCLENKVSAELLELLNAMLLGFSGDMQLEIADDLLDFACGHVIHTTGCPSADAVLDACYNWIAEEQGFEIVN